MDKVTKKLIDEAENRILRDINFLIRIRVQNELSKILDKKIVTPYDKGKEALKRLKSRN